MSSPTKHVAAIGTLFVVGLWILQSAFAEETASGAAGSSLDPTSEEAVCPHGAAICGASSVSPQVAAKMCPFLASKKAAEAVQQASTGTQMAGAVALGAGIGLWIWYRRDV